MREIKFRAWDTEEKEMREVAMLRWEDGRMSRIAGYWKGTRNNGWTDYDPESGKYILMQYTGLKDKNGAMIFEGDICVHKQISGGLLPPANAKNVQIIWTELHNGWICDDGKYQYSLQSSQLEVIGNIFENPTLLT